MKDEIQELAERLVKALLNALSQLIFRDRSVEAYTLDINASVLRTGETSLEIKLGGGSLRAMPKRPGAKYPDCDDLKKKGDKKEEKCDKDKRSIPQSLNDALNQLAADVDKRKKQDPPEEV